MAKRRDSWAAVLTKEFLEEHYVRLRKTIKTIAEEVGCWNRTVRYHMTLHGIRSRPTKERMNITGQRFGKLVAVKVVHAQVCKAAVWLFKCDCGNERTMTIGAVMTGKYTCCGCQYVGGNTHFNYKGTEHVPSAFWTRVIHSARTRDLEISITIEDAEAQFVAQGCKCAYTGVPLRAYYGRIDVGNASLDRIDSSLGYVKGNIQWVHKDINRMKWDYDEEHFLAMCCAVCHTKCKGEQPVWDTAA